MPNLTDPADGLVLAGGASRRFGSDKALAEFEGCRLIDRAVGALQLVCGEVFVAVGGRALGLPGVAELADARPGAGPLGGVLAGLEATGRPLLAVLAVDHPRPDAPLFRRLAEGWEGEDVVVPAALGRLQPLHAIWAAAAAGRIASLLDAGERSVLRVVERLRTKVVDVEDATFAWNVNTPADLRRGCPD